MDYKYIVVEGPIGSGKSALAKRLAEYFNALYLTESPENNPFLERFYMNAANHGLASELFFLLRRTEAIDIINFEEKNDRCVVADFLLEKDQIFVPVLLNSEEPGNEQTLFWQTKYKIMPEIPVPDLVIYLQTPRETIYRKLQNREDNVLYLFPEGYLDEIHQGYERFFQMYVNSPLITVANSYDVDFVNNQEHFDLLINAMKDKQGHNYFLNWQD